MNRHVPRKRARRSEIRPNASASYCGRGTPRPTSRGWSSRVERRLDRVSAATGGLQIRGPVTLAPALGQEVVEHVVDGHCTEQVVVVVDDRDGDEVVRREIARGVLERIVGIERVGVDIEDTGHER